MAAFGGSMNIDTTVTQVKRLINAHLKAVCKHAGLPVSGAKAALQSRIIDRECGRDYPLSRNLSNIATH